jgi:hypothetical protein
MISEVDIETPGETQHRVVEICASMAVTIELGAYMAMSLLLADNIADDCT